MKVLKKQNNGKTCFVCGTGNDAGLKTKFYEMEDGSVIGLVTAKEIHQSYPGRVHGGVISALLDEAIGRAINVEEPSTWGVTAELVTNYKKPVPYDVQLKVVGKIVRNTRRIFEGEGELLLPDGTVAATARAKYLKLSINDIAGKDGLGDEWTYNPSPDDPADI